MEPGSPDSHRHRPNPPWPASSSSSTAPVPVPVPIPVAHSVSLPPPHTTSANPLPPLRKVNSNHHAPHPPPTYPAYASRPPEPQTSAPPAPAPVPVQPYPESDRRHHDHEPYAPMQHDHYSHQPQHQPPQHPPPVSPAHGPYAPYPAHGDPSVVKREPMVDDPRRPSSTGHSSETPLPAASQHPAVSHHTLPPPPPPQTYPDAQSRYMNYEHGASVPSTPTGYHAPSYPPQPPTPVQQQSTYDSHGGYSSDAVYSVAYSSSYPSKKKNTRASQACDQCRQLKAKCDETKPCKTCRDKGLECKYRDPVPKATDKVQADILDGIAAMQSTLNTLTSHFGRMDERLTKMESNFSQGARSVHSERDTVIMGDAPDSARQSPSAGHAETFYPADPSGDAPGQPADQAQQSIRPIPEDEIEAEPGPVVPPGEPAIPINHTTLASLLLEWPAIRDMTKHHLEREGIRFITEFPIGREQTRGPLIVYGRGENGNMARYNRDHPEHSGHDTPDDVSDMASPSPATDFGQLGGLTPPDFEYKGGVLGVDGTPDFSEATVWKHVNQFKEHILNMHPIFQPSVLEYWVRHFLDTLPTAQPRSARTQAAPKPAFAVAANPQGSTETPGSKRKRSVEPGEPEGSPTPAPGRPGRPDRSLHSALILTILALGKICGHRAYVPDVVHPAGDPLSAVDRSIRNGFPSSPGHSPPPAYSSAPHSAQQSPGSESTDRGGQGRRSSFHGAGSSRSRTTNLKKNYEAIPGLEYFAYATDILGNFVGAYNSMKDVYANIFACLYHGQLNRPLESFAFIHRASHKLQVIMRPSLDKLRNLKKRSEFITEQKYNRLALAFWTCLQLESDLIAEFPMPPSGLLSYEDDMPHPNMSLLSGFSQKVLDSYPGQLYLRKHLNSIHRMFYAPEDHDKQAPDKLQSVELVADAVAGMHWVAPSFTFREEDPPATDLLAARLRAKYWGAQVITYRPFIREIMLFTHSNRTNPTSPYIPTWSEFHTSILLPPNHTGVQTLNDINPRVLNLAGKGVKALVESTRAFHNLGDDRPIITNIFGTAHAQWGNLLVLAAAFKDPVLNQFIDEELLRTLFQRTIQFFRQSAPATSSLLVDMHILEGMHNDLFPMQDPRTTSSMSSHTSMQTPRQSAAPAPVSANPPPAEPNFPQHG